MRAKCVGGPLDGKEVAKDDPRWAFAQVEPLPYKEWMSAVNGDIPSATVALVTYVYSFRGTGPRTGIWEFQGKR